MLRQVKQVMLVCVNNSHITKLKTTYYTYIILIFITLNNNTLNIT